MKPSRQITCMLLLLLALSPQVGRATVLGGSVANLSATQNIPYTQASSVTVRWTISRDGVNNNVSSAFGLIRDGGDTTTLATIPTTLSRAQAPPNNVFYFTESLRIPRSVLQSAYQQGFRQILYRRQFTDCPPIAGPCGSAQLDIFFTVTGSSGGTFGISNYSLRFSDGGTATIVPQQQEVIAEARFGIAGAGLLRGVWEIATPASSSGSVFFTPLTMVTRQVIGGQLRLQSPKLPTRQVGNHLVRFRVIEPGLSTDTPALQYYVGPREAARLADVETTAPANNAGINSDTRFAWRPVDRAHTYKLEIASDGPARSADPVAGMLVKASRHNVQLNASLLQKLQPGRTYRWHVLAFDQDGRIIAASNWRQLKR